jgi:cytochrome b6-f complex iron-sulfur subunit
MAKKMSVEEILAAARGGAAKKAADPAPAPAAEAPAAAAAEAPAAEDKPAAKPVKPGSMSPADILAMAKAGKKPAAAAPAAAAPKPAAPAAEKPKPSPPKTDAAVAAAVPKDTASILAAARKASKPGPMSKAEAEAKGVAPVPAGKKKLEAPPMPAKPAFAQPAATKGATESRRGFFSAAAGVLFGSSLAIGFTSLALTHVMWVLGLARFMFPNILIEPPTRFKVGSPTNFAPGQVETKFIPEFGVWVVRYEYEGRPMIFALKAVCTHLGCTPNWLEAEQKFKCPCHGSGFYKDGINFEGPAPRPLERYAISLADDGQLEIDKSRTFNQEQGQWKDSASYVLV